MGVALASKVCILHPRPFPNCNAVVLKVGRERCLEDFHIHKKDMSRLVFLNKVPISSILMDAS